jgi:predicted permease
LNSPVFASLLPVILFIAIGFLVGRRGQSTELKPHYPL